MHALPHLTPTLHHLTPTLPHLTPTPSPLPPQDNAIVECPNSKWCHPDSEDTPCQSDKPTEPTCSGENFECTDKNSFCHEGLVQKCPSDLICKGGPIPCVLEYDDTCSASDNSCLDWNDFCLGGWRYTCPEGYRCVKPEEEGQSPCIPEDWEDRYPRVDKRCWTDFDDYTCFDASHYCLVRLDPGCCALPWFCGMHWPGCLMTLACMSARSVPPSASPASHHTFRNATTSIRCRTAYLSCPRLAILARHVSASHASALLAAAGRHVGVVRPR
jgi:hypothetical protein